MAKRLKLEDIKTESYCYVGDKLVNTKDLTQEQKETLANKICLTLLRQRWGAYRDVLGRRQGREPAAVLTARNFLEVLMERQDGAVCDRDCGHCAFPDCIAPEEDISPEERAWSEQLDRETAADAAHKAARDEAARRERARAYRQAYYAANRARIQEYSKRYWAAHKAEIAAKRAARYQKNKAARDAYSKADRAAHRDEINARERDKLREKREKAAAAAAQQPDGQRITTEEAP